MINPEQLLVKAEKLFYKVALASFTGEDFFPKTIPTDKKITGTNYSDWKKDLIPLYKQSKEAIGKGYSIDWKQKTINGSKQKVPAIVYFQSLEDYLFFTGKEEEYKKLVSTRSLLLHHFAQLEEWINNNLPELTLNNDKWSDIIKCCQYFLNNKSPHPYFIRELPIEIHSKFIEQNSGILKKILDVVLPPDSINKESNDFAGRYRLKKINITTLIRILDNDLKVHLGYDECALSLEDAAWLKWLPEKVFIIENQVCFYTFPKVKNAVAIWGEGFKSRLTKFIPWLGKTKLYCWFDLDAAGFQMLNMIREHYPDAESLFMNKSTYEMHKEFSVSNKTRGINLPHLKQEEKQMLHLLQVLEIRLEQEKISQEYVNVNVNNYL